MGELGHARKVGKLSNALELALSGPSKEKGFKLALPHIRTLRCLQLHASLEIRKAGCLDPRTMDLLKDVESSLPCCHVTAARCHTTTSQTNLSAILLFYSNARVHPTLAPEP